MKLFTEYENICIAISAILALGAVALYYFFIVIPVRKEMAEGDKS